MKRFTLLAAACVLLFSCSKKSTLPEPQEPEPTKTAYKISLGFNGELNVTDESPLSSLSNKTLPRAVTSNDLLGIQVYSRAKGANGSFNPYAYGLFDNTNNLSVTLLSGYEYDFQASLVKEGKTKIHNYGPYTFPFYRSGAENGATNPGPEFIITSNSYFNFLSRGASSLNSFGSSVYNIANTDRYYGDVAGYEPSKNETLNLPMKRVVFGAKFTATGLTNGRLKISMKDAPDQYIETSTPNKTIQDIFTFDCLSCAKDSDQYTETINVTVTWLREDGAVVPIASKDIAFKRKTVTTININVADGSAAQAMSITEEPGDLTSGETIGL